MNKFFARVFQKTLKVAVNFLPWHTPILYEDKEAVLKIPEIIESEKLSRILIVTDKGISALGLMNNMLQGLEEKSIKYVIYDKTVPNPTIENIEEAVVIYKENNCDAIIAFGGGSAMDCAKGVGARISNPGKSIEKMKGLLKVRRKLPCLIAVPTTAGTGSEVTIAAVVSNPVTHEKYAINDLKLIPRYAVLDPCLTIGLPPHITATTGMDALTHAVEAYIGNSNTRKTEEYAVKAVCLIFGNLFKAYSDGADIRARGNMLKASHYAGIAFTRAYVGYVHAVAHTLSGFYSTPHGLANAVILPYVLDYYGASAAKKLARLSIAAGLAGASDSVDSAAEKFIFAIRNLNEKMNVPVKISGIKEADIPLMIERALSEGNPLYPVPKIFGAQDMRVIFDKIRD